MGIPDPEPSWEVHLPALTILAALALIGIVIGASNLSSAVGALSVGLGLIVFLGAAGLVLRGMGEQAREPIRGKTVKAIGYYLGALAYVATASAALFNGVPRLLAGG